MPFVKIMVLHVLGDREWNICGMILTTEHRITRRKTCPSARFFCPKFLHETTCYQTQAFAVKGWRAKTAALHFLEFRDIQRKQHYVVLIKTNVNNLFCATVRACYN